jgi:hypothetical protein
MRRIRSRGRAVAHARQKIRLQKRLEIPVGALACTDAIGIQRLLVRRLRVAAQAGTDEHQAIDSSRIFERKICGDHAAEREADHGGALDLQEVEERPQILDVRERRRRRRRTPVAAKIVADDEEVTGQRMHLIVPLAAVDEAAMHEHQRAAATHPLVIQVRSVDVRNPGRRCHGCRRAGRGN